MSIYNGTWDLVKPFYDLFFIFVVIPVLGIVYATSRIFVDHEQARNNAVRVICLMSGHHWADEDKYGVEPVCLGCGKNRGGE